MGLPLPRLKKIGLVSFCLCLFPAMASAQDITTGLVGHWTLDETSGATIIDSAGSNNGTWTDGANNDTAEETITGLVSNALTFDSDNRIALSNDVYDSLTEGAISAWIRWDGSVTTEISVFTQESNGYMQVNAINGNLRLYASATGCGAIQNTSDTPLIAGQWHHILFQSDGSSYELYVDGVSHPEISGSSNIFFNSCGSAGTSSYYIGSAGNFEYFDGAIDDVRIYNRTLSAADVAALYSTTVTGYLCTNPNGVEGETIFNKDVRALQYCNGTKWVGVGSRRDVINGLVGHWKLNETSGAAITDSSASSNTGTWTDGVNNSVAEETIAAKVDRGINFDGSDDIIVAGNIPELLGSNTITMAGWLKRDAAGDTVHFGVDDGGSGTTSTSIGFLNDGDLYFSVNTGGYAYGKYTLNDTNWHHVAMVYNGDGATDSDKIKGYVDGTEVALSYTGTIPATAHSNASYTMKIGRYASYNSNGSIDDIRVYDRLLSSSEITSLYTLGATCAPPLVPNLVAHWTMDDTSGTSIIDSSGNGNNGTWQDGVNNDVSEETVAGQDGTAINFNEVGTTINVTHSASLDISSAYTVSSWVYFDSTASTSPITASLISKNYVGGWGHGWVIGRTSGGGNIIGGNIRMAVQHNRSASSYSGWIYPVDQWNYVTITWDGATVRYYLNGVFIESDTLAVAPDTVSGDLQIGFGISNWYNNFFKGNIDDLRLYNTALSDTEVATLYGTIGGGECTVATCTSPMGMQGEIIYNNDYNVMQYCNGSEWIAMGPPGNGGVNCTSPTGNAGEIRYNADYKVLQYCEGDAWVGVISEKP